jgi:hypothetical protein
MKSKGRVLWDEGFFVARTVDPAERVRAPRPHVEGAVTLPLSVGFNVGSIQAIWLKLFNVTVTTAHVSDSWQQIQRWEQRQK